MAIFVTGTTGYLGSYVAAGLFTGHRDTLNLLVRAKSDKEARERLWTSLQLHFGFRGVLRIPWLACANFSRRFDERTVRA